MYELRRQPAKALYRTSHSARFWFVDFPIHAVLFSVPYFRPRPSWSWLKSVVVPHARLWSEFEDIAAKTGPVRSWPTHEALLDEGSPSSVWINPCPAALSPQVLAWAEAGSVSPDVHIPGYWAAAVGSAEGSPAASGEKVVYHFHGGGYISDSAHPSQWMAALPRKLVKQGLATRYFALEYRLTNIDPDAPKESRNPFPAALIDAIAGYVYLVDMLGFAPENVIFSGDSAGGHLALALARYIAENTAHLATAVNAFAGRTSPPDYRMLLFSPWVDMGTSHDYPGGSQREFWYDFIGDLHTSLLTVAGRVLGAPLGPDAHETNAYISPASRSTKHSFVGFPRTFVVAGDAERFFDQDVTLVDRMSADLDAGWVVFHIIKDGMHDQLLTPFDAVEGGKTLNAVEKWIRE